MIIRLAVIKVTGANQRGGGELPCGPKESTSKIMIQVISIITIIFT
jgi:hypothetical protein